MVGAQGPFEDGQRAIEKRLGLCIATLRAVERGQIAKRSANIEVVGPPGLLGNRKRAIEKRLSLGIAATVGIVRGKPTGSLSEFCVLFAMLLTCQRDVPLRYWHRQSVFALIE
jgi:hypothetical protein